MVDLMLDDRLKLSISRGEKYLIEIYIDGELVSFIDTYPSLVDSAFARARVRNEILKYTDDYDYAELDKKIVKALIENRDALKTL